jgi:DNA sulfur modification protein DndB
MTLGVDDSEGGAMNEDSSQDLVKVDLTNPQFKVELRRRRSNAVARKISHEELETFETRGYRLHKSYANHSVVKRPKTISESMEDRVWLMFFRMGFSYLNPAEFSVTTASQGNDRQKQIDVVARDGNEVIFIECKASGSEGSSSMRKEIAELGTLRQPFERWARRSICPAVRVTFILALSNISPSANDRSDAKGLDILIWENEELEYYDRLSTLIGSSTKYQLLAGLFGDVPFPEQLDPVPAISGSMGNRRFYSFCMTPGCLLKIAYVHHRFAHRAGENAYQRMLDKGKLGKISAFLDTGRFFPNNVIVNFTRKPEFIEHVTIKGVRFGYLKPSSYYASAWIIDGQHRLYGYADHQRKDSDLLPVIAFEDMSDEEQGSLFVEINKNQKSVEANLLWDLYSEIYEFSDDPYQQQLRAIANITKRLNQGRNSPFHNRIYVPSQNVKSEEVNITIQTICTAIRRNRLLAKEMLFREDFETTENYAAERIAETFGFISDRLASDWAKGELGFSRSNNGIATLFIVLRELIRFAVFTDKMDVKRSKWREYVDQVLGPAVRYLEEMDDMERSKLRGRASSEGQRTEIAKGFAVKIRDVFPSFAPDLEVPTEEEGRDENEEALVRSTELTLRHFVRDRLVSKYGDSWHREGIPEDVKIVIEDRKRKEIARYPYRQIEIDQRPAVLIDFTDIVHLGRIVTWENNRDLFSSVFGNIDETNRRMDEFQIYRNSVRHIREIDDVGAKTGKAAIAWIRKCMDAAA